MLYVSMVEIFGKAQDSLAETVGAVLGYPIPQPFMNDLVFGLLFAGVAGIMVFISLDELPPPRNTPANTTSPFTD